MLTCDGKEAEIALAPNEVEPGSAQLVEFVSRRERLRLQVTLGSGLRLDGYSTHLSAWTPHEHTAEVARIIASRFAPALMLLFDRPSSPGLLVRPRINRTELCGEHLWGDFLTAACVAVVAVVRASVELVEHPRVRRSAPPILRSKVLGTPDRFGWYVDRTAFGVDLYEKGRRSVLIDVDGRTVTAQQHLEAVWSFVRSTAAASFTPEELAAVDHRVLGAAPLPLEDDTERGAEEEGSKLCTGTQRPDGESAVLRGVVPVARPGVDLAPVMVTWDAWIFLMADTSRKRRSFVSIPHRSLDRFRQLLKSGRLDDLLLAYLLSRSESRTLERRAQLHEAGLFDDFPSRLALVGLERDPEPNAAFTPL